MTALTIIEYISRYQGKTAIIEHKGAYTYGELLASSGGVASYLLNGGEDLHEARVAFIVPSGFEYVSILLGIWRAGGIAVPLCVSHPDPEIEYVVRDSGAGVVIDRKSVV